MDVINKHDDLKSNKNFANELRKCRFILDIIFAENIEDKILVDKKEFDELRNKKVESNDTQKDNAHNQINNNNH